MAHTSLDQYVAEVKADIMKFEAAYRRMHAENPEHYPLELPEQNAGLWSEMFIDFHNGNTF